MKDEELVVVGGATSFTSAAFLNAIARGIETLFNVGKAFGSSLKLIFSKKCS